MSTRAQIIIKDADDELWFYRHSDGYPEGTMPTLEVFLEYVKEGKIRDNVGQAAGWLVIIGHREYLDLDTEYAGKPEPQKTMMGWKVGSYEPCAPVQHGDIEHLYTIDLVTKEITHEEV